MSQKQNGERPSAYSCISTIITAATPLSGGSPPSVESTTWLGITASAGSVECGTSCPVRGPEPRLEHEAPEAVDGDGPFSFRDRTMVVQDGAHRTARADPPDSSGPGGGGAAEILG